MIVQRLENGNVICIADGLERGVPFKYINRTLPNRNSVQEFEQDQEIRKAFWGIATDDVVIDVGAGFGGYTLCALARTAKFVYAFESNPEALSILRENLIENEAPHMFTHHCSTCNWHVDSGAHSIDSFFKTLSSAPQKVDWLKIDTGGNEIDVLKGARQTIEKYHPNVVIRTGYPTVLENSVLLEYGLMGYKELETLKDHTRARFQ